MTSAKCFINWVKEAGRGHLVATLGWGTLILYGVLAVTRLSFDTENTFFGIGGTALDLRRIGRTSEKECFFYLSELQPD